MFCLYYIIRKIIIFIIFFNLFNFKKAADTDLVIVHWRQSKRGKSMHHEKISQTHININTLHLQIKQKSFLHVINNQHMEQISTSMSVGPHHLSTPPYTPHNLQSSIKTLTSTPFCPRQAALIVDPSFPHNTLEGSCGT